MRKKKEKYIYIRSIFFFLVLVLKLYERVESTIFDKLLRYISV